MKPNEPVPKYLESVLAGVDLSTLVPGGVSVAQLFHADHCRRPDGGPCTCEPEIRIVTIYPKGARP